MQWNNGGLYSVIIFHHMARNRTTATEVSVSKTKEEITKEAFRIEESACISAKSHYNDSATWGFCNFALGLPTTILSGLVAIESFARFDSSNNIAGIVAIIISVLSGLMTFLNPNKRAAVHQKAGSDYSTLENRVRLFRTIDCWGKDSDAVLTAKVKEFSEKKNKLNADNPQPSPLGYILAKRGIKKGEASFKVDEKVQP